MVVAGTFNIDSMRLVVTRIEGTDISKLRLQVEAVNIGFTVPHASVLTDDGGETCSRTLDIVDRCREINCQSTVITVNDCLYCLPDQAMKRCLRQTEQTTTKGL